MRPHDATSPNHTQADSVRASVTVLVTTSPTRSDPELELLRRTFDSLALAGLGRCRTLLLCDHFEVGAMHPKRKVCQPISHNLTSIPGWHGFGDGSDRVAARQQRVAMCPLCACACVRARSSVWLCAPGCACARVRARSSVWPCAPGCACARVRACTRACVRVMRKRPYL